MKTPRLFAALVAASLAPLAAAQDDFNGVVLYEHGYYGGSTLTLYPGEGIPFLSDYWENDWETWNDQVSSLAVWGNVVVYLYSDVNYQGDVLEIYEHVESLGLWGWNDRASSVWVDWAAPEGWYWDETFYSWVYADPDGWLYHNQGLGWIYGGYYDTVTQQGWFWDQKRGWLWTGPNMGGWFAHADGHYLYHEAGTANPRWWYSSALGDWFSD